MSFDMTSVFRPDLPPPVAPWKPSPRFSFVGGNNDPESIPFGGLAEASVNVMRREGAALATYNLGGGPLGYLALREFIAAKLATRASTPCSADEILITSGSLQALDLVNEILLSPGDTVICEQATYGGALTRLQRLGVDYIGVELDDDGMRVDRLAETLDDLASRGVTPKYLYLIPSVQNPTGSVMSRGRRLEILELARTHGVPIFEDDCYADLIWDGDRPPTFRALDDGGGQVIYCGSFSKSIAPALRIGYIVADEPVLNQLLAMKTDAGTGALEQLVLAEYSPTHFDDHVERLIVALRAKCEVMAEAIREHFGDAAEFDMPKGGIFIWITLPEGADTSALASLAAKEGIELNPGVGWSTDVDYGKRRLRLCFGHPDHDTIRDGVALLAQIYHRQMAA